MFHIMIIAYCGQIATQNPHETQTSAFITALPATYEMAKTGH